MPMSYALFALAAFSANPPADAVDYARQIKPLHQRHCVAYHGAIRPRGGLRLDTASGARRGGRSGPDWDQHGGPGQNLKADLDKVCRDIDRPCAALVRDLKARGLLDSTLVVWSGEFGRTPMGEVREFVGRNHHVDAYTLWLAGGGVRPGMTLGATDEFGFAPVEDRVHVHDLQATILHLLGLEHERLTYRFQGRNFRLTDVEGRVVRKLLA